MKINKDALIGDTGYSLRDLLPYELYNDSTGKNTGTIPLNDSIQNYNYVEVYGYNSADGQSCFTKIPKEMFNISATLTGEAMDGNYYVKFLRFRFSNNTTISITKNASWWRNATGSGAYDDTSKNIYIRKVLGYK